MNIASGIKDLLYLHDCVIIPNFGGFLLNYQSATIHPVTHTFSPPSKTLAFNRNLISNDGLLANHIARKNRISYDDALNDINSWVREMRSKLEKGGTVNIDETGSFILDNEGNLQFTPDNNVNYYGDSFGLGSFSSPAIIRNRVAEEKKQEAPVVIPVSQPSRFRQLRRAAAIFLPAAIIASALLVSLINTDNSIDDKISYSGILVSCNRNAAQNEKPSNQLEPINETIVDTTAVEDQEPDTTVYISEPEKPQVPETKVASQTTPTNVPPQKSFDDPSRRFHSRFKSPDTPEMRYYIIIGSFNTLASAEAKVEELRTGYYEDSFVVSTSKVGTYRVSAVSYFGFDKAKMQLQTIKSTLNKDAWILHM